MESLTSRRTATDKGRRRLSRSQRKVLVRELLDSRDLEQLAILVAADRRYLSPVMTLLVETNDQVRWRAIEGLGRIAAELAKDDLEAVRDLLRNLLWMMNEESGANVEHAPEAIGQILVSVPALTGEYTSILAAFLDEEYFRRGVAWALSQIAARRPDLLADASADLTDALDDADPAAYAWSTAALRALGSPVDADQFVGAHEDAAIDAYDFGAGERKAVSLRDALGR